MKKLERYELKNLKGGLLPPGQCRLTWTSAPTSSPNGTLSLTYTEVYYINATGACTQHSTQANTTCLQILSDKNQTGDSCGYDCGCDGWGQ